MKKNITKKIAAIALAITSVTTTFIMPASADWSTTPFEFKTGTYTYQDYAREQKVYDVSVSEGDWYPEILYSSFEEYKTCMEEKNGQPIPLLMSYGNNNYGSCFENYTKTPYQYNALTKKEKILYKNIMKYVNADKTEVKIAKGVTDTQIQNVINVIAKFGCGVSFEFYENTRMLHIKKHTPNELFIKVAEEIEAKFPKKASDYDKVKVIHDEICRRYKYGDKDLKTKSPIAAEYIVCAGYSSLFEDFCKYFNINCTPACSVTHAWNKVEIDGNWYNVDVCWDDGGRIRYDYFLISDSRLAELDPGEDHKMKPSNSVPKCTKSYSK